MYFSFVNVYHQEPGLCGRGRGWDDLGEGHWNMYNIICDTNRQSRFDAWYRMLGAGALGWPRGMEWGGRWEGGSGWGTRVHPWWIHVNVWQKPLQYCKVINLQLKKKKKKEHGGHKERNTQNRFPKSHQRRQRTTSTTKTATKRAQWSCPVTEITLF